MRADLADWIALNMVRGIGPGTANQFNGKRSGNDMGGKWEFSGFSGTWEVKKKK